jgi:GntR family transcriptional regulator
MTNDGVDAVIQRIADSLDGTSRAPLYEQITRLLSEAIRSGALRPSTALPPEPELAERLGVSRQTANQALTKLARRGILSRVRGAGTFVAEPYIEQPLGGLYSFIRTLTAQGRLPSARLLGYRLTVDDEASRLLGGEGALVFELSRLRLVDGEPFVVETLYLPATCGERLPLERLGGESLYDLLVEVCDITVTHAEETLQPVTLERTEAALLGLPAGEPAFLVTRVGYAGERVVEYRRSLIRGDRYRFRVHLEGPHLTSAHE